MNRPSLVINRCGSWGIRTPGTRNCARQFSKLLVSATHPNFQSFGSLTSQHSFSECGCKGKEKNQFHQTFLLFFSKNRCSCMILVDIWTFFAHGFERWLHDDSKLLLCGGGTDAWHAGRGVHKASCVPRHEEQGLMCERVLKIRYRDDFLSESFHGNGSIS